MLTIANNRVLDFIDFLNKEYPIKEEVKITCLHGYDAVRDDETEGQGFAVYLPEQKYILLPMEIPENVQEEALKDPALERDFVIHNLAHEYAHAILRGYIDYAGRNVSNYHYEDLLRVEELYEKSNLTNPSVIVDTNHNNSGKQ